MRRKQQALLKIVSLSLRLDETGEAAEKLQQFMTNHPDLKNSDLEMLALGELKLKEAMAPGGATNALQQAQATFETLTNTYTNSDLLGKAELDLGWCLWSAREIEKSGPAFSNAVRRLPDLSADRTASSLMKVEGASDTNGLAATVTNHPDRLATYEDKAVAIFKWADVQYQQKQYAAAVTNYSRVVDQYGSLTAVKNELAEQALYQIVRASLAQTNVAAAQNAMKEIVQSYPLNADCWRRRACCWWGRR